MDIQVKIFDQSISFFNPGRLYGDLTIEKLKSDDYQSRTRNRLIAEAFYLTRDIEKYGSGFIRVRGEVAAYPTMRFDYEESGDGFLVTLAYEQQRISSTSADTAEISGGVSGGVNSLLAHIEKHPGQKAAQIAASLGIPKRTAERWIQQLRNAKQIEFRGAPKTGGYWIC